MYPYNCAHGAAAALATFHRRGDWREFDLIWRAYR